MTDLSKLLNKEQLEAATAPDGPLLILAAAGTGKTRTLVYRLVHLLERGYRSDQILLLTFTNRAAREMLERAAEATAGMTNGLWGGTFHSVANRILRRHATLLGYTSDFKILDADDQKALMGACLRARGYKPKEFVKKEMLLSILSGALNRGIPLEDHVAACCALGDVAVSEEAILTVLRDYLAAKREQDAMDFDDLLVNVVKLLREQEVVRKRYQEKFRHVLVDEYQDTNALQSEFVEILAAQSGNLSVVGDDYQCIYSWRGSDYENILSFPERHPGAKIVKLEENYRSFTPILNLANASIRHNTKQFDKTLRAHRASGEALLPEWVNVNTTQDQGAEVVELIRGLEADGIALRDIAILYRSHYNSKETELSIAKAKIPYRITSGIGFYEQAHIKDALSLLRVLENPLDKGSFFRLLSLFPGVGGKTCEKVWAVLGGRASLSDEKARKAFLDALPAKTCVVWKKLMPFVEQYDKTAFPANVANLFSGFLDEFYREYLAHENEQVGKWDERKDEDINELAADIGKRSSLKEFLEDVALLTNLDARVGRRGSQDGVLLSTIHQAKGLEWSAVILIGAAEGMLPSSRALDSDADDSEERRLFYVAVTRAQNRLAIVVPHVRTVPEGGMFECKPSRFLTEVDQDLFCKRDASSYRQQASFGTRYGGHVRFNWGW